MENLFVFDLEASGTGFSQIVKIEPFPGGEGFLLLNDDVSILFDSGYGFCGEAFAQQVANVLGDRTLDYILLTHSHYDHALGSAACVARWPKVTVVAAEYAAEIFKKPGARQIMQKMDESAAKRFGVDAYKDWTGSLRVDHTVTDQDELSLHGMRVQVVALPGHTKCSVGYWFLESKLLCASESLGVYEGGDLISASFLVGFGMTKASMARAMALQPEHMLVPHTGLIHHEACMTYLKKGEAWADCAKDLIVKACEDGYEDAKICRMLKETFYTGWNREKQPEAAFDLNAGYQVALIRKEFFGSGYEKDKKGTKENVGRNDE